MMGGWVGVDLDGTLAEYNGWNGGEIGGPVAPMVERVKHWLSQGIEVRIMTARVAPADSSLQNDQGVVHDQEFVDDQTKRIQAWCLKHIGQELRVTASKDLAMIELWDDRAVTVQPNTGRVLTFGR